MMTALIANGRKTVGPVLRELADTKEGVDAFIEKRKPAMARSLKSKPLWNGAGEGPRIHSTWYSFLPPIRLLIA